MNNEIKKDTEKGTELGERFSLSLTFWIFFVIGSVVFLVASSIESMTLFIVITLAMYPIVKYVVNTWKKAYGKKEVEFDEGTNIKEE